MSKFLIQVFLAAFWFFSTETFASVDVLSGDSDLTKSILDEIPSPGAHYFSNDDDDDNDQTSVKSESQKSDIYGPTEVQAGPVNDHLSVLDVLLRKRHTEEATNPEEKLLDIPHAEKLPIKDDVANSNPIHDEDGKKEKESTEESATIPLRPITIKLATSANQEDKKADDKKLDNDKTKEEPVKISLEALVWGLAAIYLVGVYGCSWGFFDTPKGANPWSMLYVTYFMGSCGGVQGALDKGFVLSPPTDPAKHLHIWMWVYMIASVAWVPACILLTVAASVEVRGRQGALLYYPWLILTTTFIILDLAGAIYYFLDILQTTTPDKYASLTGNTTWAILTLNASSEGVTTWLPSLFITLFFCRLLLLWVINIFFLYGVYKGCDAVSLYTTKYLQSSLMQEENKKSWKTRFYQGPDPSIFEQRNQPNAVNEQNIRSNNNIDPRLKSEQQRTDDRQESAVRYRMDDFGIPIEELRPSDGREVQQNEQDRADRGPRSPFKPGVFDYSGRPVRSDSFKEHWRDNPPPLASGVQVPPELNKFEPFSYTAGDQPQRMRRPVSRNNSRGEQPPIPRPDYTIADRRAASLEYVPNRFRVPSPKRPQSMNFEPSAAGSRPIPPSKVPPTVPKKPSVYPRSIPEDPETRYIPQQAMPGQQPSYYTRQVSDQNSNFNINKLY